MRDSLVTLLALNGHQVTSFATGRDFLEATCPQAAGDRPDTSGACRPASFDCVVCEAELPDTSGIELFRAFRASFPATRFALLTSRTDHGTRLAARVCGVDAVFEKPLVSRRLRAFVLGF